MDQGNPNENTPRVIAAAVAFFGGAAALGWAAGIHQRLAADELAALAFFAVTFAVLTYAVDRKVRDAVNGAVKVLKLRGWRMHSASTSSPR